MENGFFFLFRKKELTLYRMTNWYVFGTTRKICEAASLFFPAFLSVEGRKLTKVFSVRSFSSSIFFIRKHENLSFRHRVNIRPCVVRISIDNNNAISKYQTVRTDENGISRNVVIKTSRNR